MDAQVEEISSARKPVCVEVKNGKPGLVLLNENKRRAADRAAILDSQPLGDCPDEVRFSRAQLTDKSNHRTRKKHTPQAASECERRLGVGKLDLVAWAHCNAAHHAA